MIDNSYELAARQLKVTRLLAFIERTSPSLTARDMEQWEDGKWRSLAADARVKALSHTTQRMVVDELRRLEKLPTVAELKRRAS